MFYQSLCTPRANFSISRNSYNPYLGASFSSDANTRLLHDEGNRIMSLQSGIRCRSIVTKQRTIGTCKGYLSSNHSFRSFIQSRKLDKLDNWQYQKSENVKVNRIRADYKPEDIDITETEVDSLTPSGEAVLADGKVFKTSAWWEIPKRWVIVLLCFTAFLLCNMDRVSLSLIKDSL